MTRAVARLALLTVAASLCATSSSHALILKDIQWENIGQTVEFTVSFLNDEVDPTTDIRLVLNGQRFGAFLPNEGEICTVEIPPIPGGGTVTEMCIGTEGVDIPPRAQTIDPVNNPEGRALTPAGDTCGDFWNGNIEVIWKEGGGQVPSGRIDVHRAELPVCFDFGDSFVEVEFGCTLEVFWSFSGVCAGWSATLVDEFFAPAPNPLPAGPFTGWIAVVPPDAASGSCTIDLDVSCGVNTATMTIFSEICECGQVPVEPATWGEIKALHR